MSSNNVKKATVSVALTAYIIILNDLLQLKYTMHFDYIVNIAFYT